MATARARTFAGSLFILEIELLCACAGNVTSPRDAGEGGSSDGAIDGSSLEATGVVDAGDACATPDAADAAVAAQDQGNILVLDIVGGGALAASFVRAGTVVAPPACATAMVGGCEVSTNCPQASAGCKTPARSSLACDQPVSYCRPPNAGEITFDSPDGGAYWPVTVKPDRVNGFYPDDNLAEPPPFVSGDTVTVSAAGGDVPGFSASVVAPGCASLVSPPPPDAGYSPTGYTVATSEDLAVSWTAGESNAIVHVLLEASTRDYRLFVDVDCAFDGQAGHGTVSHNALAALRGMSGSLNVYQERTRTFSAGSYAITLIARAVAVESGGPQSIAACLYNSSGAVFR